MRHFDFDTHPQDSISQYLIKRVYLTVQFTPQRGNMFPSESGSQAVSAHKIIKTKKLVLKGVVSYECVWSVVIYLV